MPRAPLANVHNELVSGKKHVQKVAQKLAFPAIVRHTQL